jgi:hypothetical protein
MMVRAVRSDERTDALARRAIQNGDLRSDLEPFDLLRALIGVAQVPSGPDWQPSAKRLVDILATGSRPAKWARGLSPGWRASPK